MNFFKSLTLGAASLFVFSQCGGGADFSKPESVAVEFTKASANMDFAKAKTFCDESTAKILDMAAGMANMAPAEEKKKGQEKAKLIKSAKCEVNGDKAKCTVCCDDKGADSPEKVDLVKTGGKWLVTIDKGAMGGGDSTPTPEPAPADTTSTAPADTTAKQ